MNSVRIKKFHRGNQEVNVIEVQRLRITPLIERVIQAIRDHKHDVRIAHMNLHVVVDLGKPGLVADDDGLLTLGFLQDLCVLHHAQFKVIARHRMQNEIARVIPKSRFVFHENQKSVEGSLPG